MDFPAKSGFPRQHPELSRMAEFKSQDTATKATVWKTLQSQPPPICCANQHQSLTRSRLTMMNPLSNHLPPAALTIVQGHLTTLQRQ